jgi:hypothetical protein
MNEIKKPHADNMRLPIKNKQNYLNRYFQKRLLDRSLLPSPLAYYRQHFPTLRDKSKWVTVHCCFHEDRQPSLALHLPSGAFRCFGCGAKGGDLIAFHMKRYGMSFIATVNYFGGWRYEF